MNAVILAFSLVLASLGQQPASAQEPRAFPRLKPPEQEKVNQALFRMRSAKTAKTRADARATVAASGAAAVPACLQAFGKFAPDRQADLCLLLDQILAAVDLDLALAEVGPKAAPPARHYVIRRIADGTREDTPALLQPALRDSDPEVAYQAARGLAVRGDAAAVPVLHGAIRSRWKEEEALLRADLAKVPRGPLSAAAAALIQNGSRDDRLAGIRVFTLFGVREHAPALRPALDDPDQQILLNAINACRAVVDGAPPLERPSSPQIIEQVQAWKARL